MLPTTRIRSMQSQAAANMDAQSFREIGYMLVDDIGSFLESLPERPVTNGKQPGEIQNIIGNSGLPTNGSSRATILKEASQTWKL